MLHVKIEYLWNKVLSTKVYGGNQLEDPGVDGRIILSVIFRKRDVGTWTGLIWLRIWTGGGTCKCGNEPWGFIICGEFIDWLRTD
jgi:hypothetical protein